MKIDTTPALALALLQDLEDIRLKREYIRVFPDDSWSYRPRQGVVQYHTCDQAIFVTGNLDRWRLRLVKRAEYRPPEPVLWPFEASPHRAPRWA